jgi:hypothetical protein
VTVAKLVQPFRAWLRRRELDHRIALGADPGSSPELSLRARQLVAPRFRVRMAAGLRGAIRAAEHPWPRGVTAQVPLQRGVILEERAELLGLARLLTEEQTVSARGVARVEELLTDGCSPLYYPSPQGALSAALRHARTTLLLA